MKQIIIHLFCLIFITTTNIINPISLNKESNSNVSSVTISTKNTLFNNKKLISNQIIPASDKPSVHKNEKANLQIKNSIITVSTRKE